MPDPASVPALSGAASGSRMPPQYQLVPAVLSNKPGHVTVGPGEAADCVIAKASERQLGGKKKWSISLYGDSLKKGDVSYRYRANPVGHFGRPPIIMKRTTRNSGAAVPGACRMGMRGE